LFRESGLNHKRFLTSSDALHYTWSGKISLHQDAVHYLLKALPSAEHYKNCFEDGGDN